MKPPPATESKPKKPRKLKSKTIAAPPWKPATQAEPEWRAQFRALATALGLDPESMLETYCREWVEATRARALTTITQTFVPFVQTQIPNPVTEVATSPNGSEV